MAQSSPQQPYSMREIIDAAYALGLETGQSLAAMLKEQDDRMKWVLDTVTAAGAAFTGTISSAGIAAGDVLAWATTSGTCASIDNSSNRPGASNLKSRLAINMAGRNI